MGLDQYAYKTTGKVNGKVDFDEPENTEKFFQWRKHSDLQGWMEKLYRAKGGKDEYFNCTPVVLTLDDLDSLENDIRQHKLPTTTGFFFGQSYGNDYELADDLDFIDKARRAVKDGYTVYYSSWW